ncbi:hypothetical protein AVEN_103810-1 [Araneus ventricosus]|uniref:Uncharacterized protein n=1 Tax=Araneus ventricosus TaxID=182803 RepID=A0A4Y2G981_ARAVE|nr:hypothetical protein AVEN_103810-1 [Araneus ventricosus]
MALLLDAPVGLAVKESAADCLFLCFLRTVVSFGILLLGAYLLPVLTSAWAGFGSSVLLENCGLLWYPVARCLFVSCVTSAWARYGSSVLLENCGLLWYPVARCLSVSCVASAWAGFRSSILLGVAYLVKFMSQRLIIKGKHDILCWSEEPRSTGSKSLT